jgi:type VI secretion system protein ImpL
MSFHGYYLQYFLGVGSITSFYSIVCLFLYFVPLPFSWWDWKVRLIIIGLILVTWPIALVVNHIRVKRAARAAAAETNGDAAAASAADGTQTAPAPSGQTPATPTPTRTFPELTRSTEEAVQWLRGTRLSGQARAGDAVYALPWFLVAGPPASGKTSMLLSSGLDFQTLPSQRRADQNLIRPTRDCEWRVTDSAILIDTSGRYQTENPPDREEWSALIETLKKYRRDRPLDGFVLAVNAAELMRMNEAEIEQQAQILRTRLDEVMQRAETRFPVYLVFTHADAVEGFDTFFRPMGRAERVQVWGTTIPLAQSQNSHALFDQEFNHLYAALMRRRLGRMTATTPADEQLRIFNFAVRLNEARDPFALFTLAMFRPNPFSESPILRGFYFMSSAARGNGAALRAIPPPTEETEGEQTEATEDAPARPAQQATDGFFIERFFKEVLLRDSDIAAALQAGRRKASPLRNVAIALTAVVLSLLLLLTLISYITNRLLIRDATLAGSAVETIVRADAGRDPATKDAEATLGELRAVDQLRAQLERLDNPLIYGRLGLYSGAAIAPRLRAIYFDAINRRFFTRAISGLETDLRGLSSGTQASAGGGESDRERAQDRQYNLLKTYVMLAQPANMPEEALDPVFLETQLRDYWQRGAPASTGAATTEQIRQLADAQLRFYVSQVSREDVPRVPRETVSGELVQTARRTLNYPVARRIYRGITDEVNRLGGNISLDTIGGGGIITATTPVVIQRSFTREGYSEVLSRIDSASDYIGRDNWVTEAPGATTAPQNADAEIRNIRDFYHDDYINQWRNLLASLRVRDFSNQQEATQVLTVLSRADSPLNRVMQRVAENTNLTAQPATVGWIDWLKSFIWSSGAADSPDVRRIEGEFASIITFAAAPAAGGDANAGTPASQYRAAIAEALTGLGRSGTQRGQTTQNLSGTTDTTWLTETERKVNDLLQNFQTASARPAAALLRQPVDNLQGLLYRDDFNRIAQEWSRLQEEAVALENSGFPFRGSQAGTELGRVTQFLNPVDGRLWGFFRRYIEPHVEDAGGQWRLRENPQFNFSPEFITYLNNARRLRDALFVPTQREPKVDYNIELQPVRDALIEVTIDGNTIRTQGDAPASSTFSWPAARGSANGVTINVTRTAAGSAPTGGLPVTGSNTQTPTTGATTTGPRTFTGPWGLYEMLRAGQGGGANMPATGYALTIETNGVPVRLNIRPQSQVNPFQFSLFESLRAPRELRVGGSGGASSQQNPASQPSP